jgi:hypothetical protein
MVRFLRMLLLAVISFVLYGCVPATPVRVVGDMEHADWFYDNAIPGVTTEEELKFHMSPANYWLEDGAQGKVWHHDAGYNLESESQSTLGTTRTYYVVIPKYGEYRTDKLLYMVIFHDGKLQRMSRIDY